MKDWKRHVPDFLIDPQAWEPDLRLCIFFMCFVGVWILVGFLLLWFRLVDRKRVARARREAVDAVLGQVEGQDFPVASLEKDFRKGVPSLMGKMAVILWLASPVPVVAGLLYLRGFRGDLVRTVASVYGDFAAADRHARSMDGREEHMSHRLGYRRLQPLEREAFAKRTLKDGKGSVYVVPAGHEPGKPFTDLEAVHWCMVVQDLLESAGYEASSPFLWTGNGRAPGAPGNPRPAGRPPLTFIAPLSQALADQGIAVKSLETHDHPDAPIAVLTLPPKAASPQPNDPR